MFNVYSSEDTQQRLFEKSYKDKYTDTEKIRLQIILNPSRDSLSFLVRNTSEANVKIMPFTMGSNYLLIKKPNGGIIRIAASRRGQSIFYDVSPGKEKVMRELEIKKFINSYIVHHKTFGKYEILWCIDLFQNKKKITYTSNLFIIDFKQKMK
jgi:hypothetical protein